MKRFQFFEEKKRGNPETNKFHTQLCFNYDASFYSNFYGCVDKPKIENFDWKKLEWNFCRNQRTECENIDM